MNFLGVALILVIRLHEKIMLPTLELSRSGSMGFSQPRLRDTPDVLLTP